uniref:Uncharacterized protein n=1 Tax=Glossina brevipalpis TaxID=37001 RepID=A0A1A9W6K6_9MUSC
MQTAVDCKGSSSIKSTTTTTTTNASLDATSRNVDIYTTTPGGSVADNGGESNILRHRGNISHAIEMMDRKNGSIHYMESDEYLGSNVKCMSVTPSPSPQSSPSKQYKPKVEPLPIITAAAAAAAAAAIIIKDDLENACNTANGSDSSSSKSNSNSNSASTTSSVINTPTLVRNGNAFKPEANSKGITISSYEQDEENQAIVTGIVTTTATAAAAATTTTTTIRENTQLLSINTKTLPIVVTSVDLKESPSSVFSSSSTSCISSSSSSGDTATTNSTNSSSISTTPASTTPASTTATPATISPTKSSSISGLLESELLQWQDMPQYLQFNPYVLKGYRPLQTFKGCLLSLFYWHNETINILTHGK